MPLKESNTVDSDLKYISKERDIKHICLLSIALFVLIYYVINIAFYVKFVETVLPFGDPFTYTTGLFLLLDSANENYLSTLINSINGSRNWYWLLHFLVSLFSPFLIKEPFSLSFVNFFMFLLASLSLFRLARAVGASPVLAFISGMVIWVYPVNYGFATYSSVPVLSLDAMFNGALFVAVAHGLVFALYPHRTMNAVLAGVTFGIAVWGRGNSLPVVGLVTFIPLIWTACQVVKERNLNLLGNFAIYTAIALSMTVFFYWSNWNGLVEYYAHHVAIIAKPWSYKNAMLWLSNVPGFFFWRDQGSVVTVTATILSHILVPCSVWAAFAGSTLFPKTTAAAVKVISITGVFIYFGTYAANLILFTDPIGNVYNVLLIYRPMLLGMSLSLIVLCLVAVLYFKLHLSRIVIAPVLFGMWALAVVFTVLQTPLSDASGRPSPVEVERFSINLDQMLKGGPLGILWYGYYNPNIINYYRKKNNLEVIPIYRNKYYNELWAFVDYSDKNRKQAKEEIKQQFENASIIIIPELLSSYSQNNPYPLYRFREEIARYLNSSEAPKFVLRGVLQDHPGARLLILERKAKAGNLGRPLKLPWGGAAEMKKKSTQLKYLTGNTGKSPRVDRLLVEPVLGSGPGGQPILQLIESREVGAHVAYLSFAAKKDRTYRLSVWLKSEGVSAFRLQLSDTYGASLIGMNGRFGEGAQLLSQGSSKDASIMEASMQKHPGDWFKVVLAGRLGSSSTSTLVQIILSRLDGSIPYKGDGRRGLLVSGLKVE